MLGIGDAPSPTDEITDGDVDATGGMKGRRPYSLRRFGSVVVRVSCS